MTRPKRPDMRWPEPQPGDFVVGDDGAMFKVVRDCADRLCPCQDGDPCHYQPLPDAPTESGREPMPIPTPDCPQGDPFCGVCEDQSGDDDE